MVARMPRRYQTNTISSGAQPRRREWSCGQLPSADEIRRRGKHAKPRSFVTQAAQAIAAQRAWVRESYPEDCEWLLPRVKANSLGKQPRGYTFIYETLRPWAEALDLRDEHGEPVRPLSARVQSTYATGLVNNDVDLFSVQSLLDHDSPDMTLRYERLNMETLRRKWEQAQQRINTRGEIVLASASRAARAHRAANRAGQAERQRAADREQRGHEGEPRGDHSARRATRTTTTSGGER